MAKIMTYSKLKLTGLAVKRMNHFLIHLKVGRLRIGGNVTLGKVVDNNKIR